MTAILIPLAGDDEIYDDDGIAEVDDDIDDDDGDDISHISLFQ